MFFFMEGWCCFVENDVEKGEKSGLARERDTGQRAQM